MTSPHDLNDRHALVASVIAAAREDFITGATGRTVAGFDYGIAAGDQVAWQSMDNALFRIANRGHDSDTSASCNARWQDFAKDLAADLEEFRARCKRRKYTGWSSWSTHPIRYAD